MMYIAFSRLVKPQAFLFIFILSIFSCSSPENTELSKQQFTSPEQIYGQLFYDVQNSETVFSDSKLFVDCIPLYGAEYIVSAYAKLEPKTDASIRTFVDVHFKIPSQDDSYVTDSSSINEHITKLWTDLSRPADVSGVGSLIALPNPYIIPGGRFREVYYWDSYFTMLGLQADGKVDEMQNIVDNFSYLIDTIGFIPNGNRTYYMSRSQPPFYALMVALLAAEKGESVYKTYLPYLEKEYAFWMNGFDSLNVKQDSYRRIVRLSDGEILNRYWDDQDTPRPESYREDIQTATEAVLLSPGLKKENVYRNLRAAAESGWDFSSRWLNSGDNNSFPLSTIHTTEIIPADLNALLYHLEGTISNAYHIVGDSNKANNYKNKANARKKAILKYCWSDVSGFFMDYNFTTQKTTTCFSIAGVYPLFFGIASKEQALKVSAKVEYGFLNVGGVTATLHKTSQQWDSPNGWAPLQWITIVGLRNYGYDILAHSVKTRWLTLNNAVYVNTYKLLEKYNVTDLTLKGGGGEYPNQDGFGWTNGVYQKLSKE